MILKMSLITMAMSRIPKKLPLYEVEFLTRLSAWPGTPSLEDIRILCPNRFEFKIICTFLYTCLKPLNMSLKTIVQAILFEGKTCHCNFNYFRLLYLYREYVFYCKRIGILSLFQEYNSKGQTNGARANQLKTFTPRLELKW